MGGGGGGWRVLVWSNNYTRAEVCIIYILCIRKLVGVGAGGWGSG